MEEWQDEHGRRRLLLVEFPRRSLDTVLDDLTAGVRIARRYATEDD
jgi:hypothetical protein